MGYRFSVARRPQLVFEGSVDALVRFGWDYQSEHEHGMSYSFCKHLIGDSDLSPWREDRKWIHSPRSEGETDQCDWNDEDGLICCRQIGHERNHSSGGNILQTVRSMPIKAENVLFCEHLHVVDHQWNGPDVPEKGAETKLVGIWLGGHFSSDQIEETTQWLWRREGPSFIRGSVEVAWHESSVSLWLVKNSEAHKRLESAIRNGTTVFGLTPRIPRHRNGRTEPYIATSPEFAYSVLG